MSGCFTTIFKYWFWGFAFVLLCILGSIVQCSTNAGYSYTRHQVRSSLEDNDLDAAVSRMHDYFVDECYADTMQVTLRQGALAEEVIDQCLEKGDIKNAQLMFRDYKSGLSEYARGKVFRYMSEHNIPDSLEYK